jgi:invasion protein IalB
MWKWLLFVILPIVVLAGGIAWYLTVEGESGLPQVAQFEKTKTPARETTSPTLKPDQKPQPQNPGPGWAVNCTSDAKDATLRCGLSQTVVMKKSGRVLSRVTFLLPAGGQEPRLNLQLPLGVLISAGAAVRVDDNPPQGLRFRTCNRGGCYAETPLTQAFLAQLRKGSKLVIEFKNLAEKTLKLPLSLDGFDEAYAKAQSA